MVERYRRALCCCFVAAAIVGRRALLPPANAQESSTDSSVQKGINILVLNENPARPANRAWLEPLSNMSERNPRAPHKLEFKSLDEQGDSPSAGQYLAKYLENIPAGTRFNLWIRWPDQIEESLPIFMPQKADAELSITMPASQSWPPNESALVRVEQQLASESEAAALMYYFAGRAVFAGISRRHKFGRVGARAIRDWFVGSFALVKALSIVGVDYELIVHLSEFIEQSKLDSTTYDAFHEQFMRRNKSLLSEYLKLPSARDIILPEPMRAWLDAHGKSP